MTNSYAPHHLASSASAKPFTLGPTATRVLLVIFFSVLLLLYLAQSTQGATRQYEVRNLEDSLASLQQDRQQLELEATRLQALNAVAPVPPPPKDGAPPPDPKTIPAIQSGDLVPAERILSLPATASDHD